MQFFIFRSMSDTNDRCLNFYMSVKTQRQTGNYLVIGLSRIDTDLLFGEKQ